MSAMTGLEVAVGFLVAWFARKAGRRVDAIATEVVYAQLDRLHEVVTRKLGGDSALQQLQLEAAETGEVGTRTQTRVRLALEEAAEQDPAFAADLEDAVTKLRTGDHGIAIGRDVRADSGIAITMTGGTVNLGQPPDPPGPAGSSPRT